MDGDTIYSIMALLAILALSILSLALLCQKRRLKKTSDLLAESEKRFRTLVEQAGDGFELIAENGQILDMNSASCNKLGYSKTEVLTKNIVDIDPTLTKESFAAGFASLVGAPPVTFKSIHKRKDGTTFPVEITTSVFELGGKHVSLALARDITERERDLARLDYATSCFTQALNSRHHVLYRLNVKEGGYDYLSPAFEQMTGYPAEEFRKNTLETLKDFFHPQDRISVFAAIDEAFNNRTTDTITLDLEYRLRKADGGYCWLLDSTTASFNEEGDLESFFGSAHDITEAKIAEKEREQFHTLFMTSDDIMVIADPNGAFLHTNPSCSLILGYSKDELIARPFMEFVYPPDQQSTLCELEQQMRTGHSFKFENRYVCKNGTLRWLSWSATYNQNDRMTYATARDFTERKEAEEERNRLEQQLLQGQKLESLGVLAGGIAHDFNNILTSVVGNVDLAFMHLPPHSPAEENLQRIRKAADRAADLAKQMLAYAGRGKFVVEPVDMNSLVEEMGHMLQVSATKNAVLCYQLTKPLPAIEADATQIRQVVMNLVINASEAIGSKNGTVTITTGYQQCDEKYLQSTCLSDHIPEGMYVFVEVTDTGCGIPLEIQSKIFDPFFTTKFTGRGLGMAAVLGVVRGHKGAIKIDSNPGSGTTFKVLFPASEKACGAVGVRREETGWKGHGKVLLVDDEETVREIGGELLKQLGLTPITACNGREAIEVFKNTGDIIFVILDLTMPEMDGIQCFQQLLALDPGVKVIMASGFTEYEVTRKIGAMKAAGFVEKPYSLVSLRNKIRQVFDQLHEPDDTKEQ